MLKTSITIEGLDPAQAEEVLTYAVNIQTADTAKGPIAERMTPTVAQPVVAPMATGGVIAQPVVAPMATGGVIAQPVVGVPAELPTVAPAQQPTPGAATGQRDAHGVLHNADIHAALKSAKPTTDDGSWRSKRGAKSNGVFVSPELKAVYDSLVAEAVAAGVYTGPETTNVQVGETPIPAGAVVQVQPHVAPEHMPGTGPGNINPATGAVITAVQPEPIAQPVVAPVVTPEPAPIAATFESLQAFTTDAMVSGTLSLDHYSAFLVAFNAVVDGVPSVNAFAGSDSTTIQSAIDHVKTLLTSAT